MLGLVGQWPTSSSALRAADAVLRQMHRVGHRRRGGSGMPSHCTQSSSPGLTRSEDFIHWTLGGVMRRARGIRPGLRTGHRLKRPLPDRSTPQERGWRARIIPTSADHCSRAERMRQAENRRPAQRRQRRPVEAGSDGSAHDELRGSGPPAPAAVGPEAAQNLAELLGERTYRTVGARAAESGISLSSVATLTLRCTAPVLSLDQKPEMQASGRIRPGLPMKKHRAGNMITDYGRQGTTTLLTPFIGSTQRDLDEHGGSSSPLDHRSQRHQRTAHLKAS